MNDYCFFQLDASIVIPPSIVLGTIPTNQGNFSN
jgi:hypothetical protein